MKLPLICPEKECCPWKKRLQPGKSTKKQKKEGCRGKKDCTRVKGAARKKKPGKKEGIIPLHA